MEMAFTVRGSWSGVLYGYEKQRFKAERVKARFAKREIPTRIQEEPLDGLFEEITEDQI